MTKDEALKLALEALELSNANHWWGSSSIEKAITAIKEALAQHDSVQAKPEPEQEPVATVESVATVVSESGNQEVTMSWWHEPALPVGTKLYTTPPQEQRSCDRRTWVGLTDEERETATGWSVEHIEDFLKQKNGYAEEKNNG